MYTAYRVISEFKGDEIILNDFQTKDAALNFANGYPKVEGETIRVVEVSRAF